jgi:hypothetical protein
MSNNTFKGCRRISDWDNPKTEKRRKTDVAQTTTFRSRGDVLSDIVRETNKLYQFLNSSGVSTRVGSNATLANTAKGLGYDTDRINALHQELSTK